MILSMLQGRGSDPSRTARAEKLRFVSDGYEGRVYLIDGGVDNTDVAAAGDDQVIYEIYGECVANIG